MRPSKADNVTVIDFFNRREAVFLGNFITAFDFIFYALRSNNGKNRN